MQQDAEDAVPHSVLVRTSPRSPCSPHTKGILPEISFHDSEVRVRGRYLLLILSSPFCRTCRDSRHACIGT